jgi:dienelactone hydrolase
MGAKARTRATRSILTCKRQRSEQEDPMAQIKTENVTYTANDTTLKGFLAYDAAVSGPRPGVLVVHEWWGVDDHIRDRVRKLAALGYTALAVDMYGGGKTANNPEAAGSLMNAVLSDMDTGVARFRAGRKLLAAHASVDESRLAAIGYCFGGAVVLHAAKIGIDLAGVVSFHGALGSMHRPARDEVKARVLVCHGGADQFVSDEDIATFKQEMDAAGADYRFIVYDGALHGFTNPQATANGEKYGLPLKYDAAADDRSWHDMQAFFNEIF